MRLNIPQQNDPVARLALIALVAVVCYAFVVSATAPERASAHAKLDPIIIVATPALPTAAPALALEQIAAPTSAPVLAMPTPTQAPDANITTAVATPDWGAIEAERQAIQAEADRQAQAWAQAQADAAAAQAQADAQAEADRQAAQAAAQAEADRLAAAQAQAEADRQAAEFARLNDPARNGGNIPDPNCPFPQINGICGNGQPAPRGWDDVEFIVKIKPADPNDPRHQEAHP